MTDSLTDKVAQLSHPEKLYFDTVLKNSDENIFTSIKSLRKQFTDGEIEPEYREASTLALVAMEAHLRGDDAPTPATDAEALADLQARIKQAAASGDRETYDSLRAGLAHAAEKAIAADDLHEKRMSELDETHQAIADEQESTYKQLMTDWKDQEILNLRRSGMPSSEAESHYEQWSAKPMEVAARKASGYTHKEPIAVE
jgi:hypothetical protein